MLIKQYGKFALVNKCWSPTHGDTRDKHWYMQSCIAYLLSITLTPNPKPKVGSCFDFKVLVEWMFLGFVIPHFFISSFQTRILEHIQLFIILNLPTSTI